MTNKTIEMGGKLLFYSPSLEAHIYEYKNNLWAVSANMIMNTLPKKIAENIIEIKLLKELIWNH